MEVTVKGTAVRTLPLFVRKRFGDDGYDLWYDALSPESQEIFSQPIHATEWYPLHETLVGPTALICRIFYRGETEGAWESGRFSADYALKGIYKGMVRERSPEYLVSRAETTLPTYFDPCTLQIVDNSSGHACLRITEFPGMHEIIELRVAGWMERALEICGASDVKVVVTRSLTRGDPVTEFNIEWAEAVS